MSSILPSPSSCFGENSQVPHVFGVRHRAQGRIRNGPKLMMDVTKEAQLYFRMAKEGCQLSENHP